MWGDKCCVPTADAQRVVCGACVGRPVTFGRLNAGLPRVWAPSALHVGASNSNEVLACEDVLFVLCMIQVGCADWSVFVN